MSDRPALSPVPAFVDLRSRLGAGETLFGSFVAIGAPVVTEILARAGFDWLLVDLEHGLTTEADLVGNLHAIGTTGTAALVRPQSAERLRIGRALDLGAHGLMIPRMDTPDQVREAIAFMRFPPDGTRGVALSTRGAGLGERGHGDIRTINPHIMGIIQIESPSAVEHAAEIASIDGVDVLFVGPADLSHSLGVPGRFDDAGYLGAINHVATVAEAAGKAAGILLYDPATVAAHRDLGYRFIGLGADSGFVASGARAILKAADPGR